jgi:hypothetical protein
MALLLIAESIKLDLERWELRLISTLALREWSLGMKIELLSKRLHLVHVSGITQEIAQRQSTNSGIWVKLTLARL